MSNRDEQQKSTPAARPANKGAEDVGTPDARMPHSRKPHSRKPDARMLASSVAGLREHVFRAEDMHQDNIREPGAPAADRDAHLVETRMDSRSVYEGSFLKARRDTVGMPDGSTSTREYIIHPGAVVIIPLLDDHHVMVERQYRYPVGRVMTEFPAGKLDPGEDPLVCAQRELLEETGYTATHWARAGALHLAIAYSTEIIHIFVARGLKGGARKLDADEFLDVCSLPDEALFAACRDGGVTDAKTLTCTLWLQNIRSGAWPLDWKASG